MSELKRHMGLFQLTMYGTGLILGAGISVYMAFQFEIEVVLVGIAIIGIGAVFYKISKNSRLKS